MSPFLVGMKCALLTAFAFTVSTSKAAPVCADLFGQVNENNSLYRRLLYSATLTGGTLSPYVALAGGFSGSGGGGGVAVFRNSNDAENARQNRGLSGEVLSKNLTEARVISLERWDLERANRSIFKLDQGADWKAYLKRAKLNLRMVSPILAAKLEQISTKMDVREWEAVGDLPTLDDVFFARPLAKNEVYVQLAIRLSAGNNARESGPPGAFPQVTVLFNEAISKRMDPVDKAILVLHEELYALGQSVGLRDSDEIRTFVAHAFSARLDNIRLNGRTQDSEFLIRLIRNKLKLYFREYELFFTDISSTTAAPRSPERHLALLSEITRELRAQIEARRSAHAVDPHDPNLYFFPNDAIPKFAKEVSDYASHAELNPEKAFIFFTHYILDQQSRLVDSESIMDVLSEKSVHERRLKLICASLKQFATKTQGEIRYNANLQRALNYCL